MYAIEMRALRICTRFCDATAKCLPTDFYIEEVDGNAVLTRLSEDKSRKYVTEYDLVRILTDDEFAHQLHDDSFEGRAKFAVFTALNDLQDTLSEELEEPWPPTGREQRGHHPACLYVDTSVYAEVHVSEGSVEFGFKDDDGWILGPISIVTT